MDLDMAYLAGLMDGDGSFSLVKTTQSSGRPQYAPMIQLCSKMRPLVEKLLPFGGSIFTRKSYVAKDGGQRKINYRWSIKGLKQCLPFLENIIPYLVIKKQRAEFLKDYILANPHKPGVTLLSDDELCTREKAYIKMKKYNDSPCIADKKMRQTQSLDKECWKYMAGIMDSDGSFSIKREKRHNRPSPSYTPMISITMTDCRALYFIMSKFIGGNLITIKAKTSNTGFCYRLSISAKKKVMDFLSKCAPYLFAKKGQADILLDFCNNSKTTLYKQGGISEEELKFRDNCYSKLVRLNNMGSLNLL